MGSSLRCIKDNLLSPSLYDEQVSQISSIMIFKIYLIGDKSQFVSATKSQ